MKKTSITKKINIKAIFIFVILITGISPVVLGQAEESSRFLSLTVDPGKSKIELYWKDDKNEIIRNFQNLKSYVDLPNTLRIWAAPMRFILMGQYLKCTSLKRIGSK